MLHRLVLTMNVTTAQNLPKAKLIENVEEKGFTGYHKLSEPVWQIALEKLRSKAAEIIYSQALGVAESKFGKCAELNELCVDPLELLELFLNLSYQLL